MHRAKQEIFSVDVIDVYRIAVTPARGPWLRDYKPISAVLKARSSFNDYGLADRERMLPAEVRAETVVGNATTLPPLNGMVMAIVLAHLLISMFFPVLIGLPISVFVLLLISVLIYSSVVLSILRVGCLGIRLRTLVFLRM